MSTSFQSPMRWPLREFGSTCGAALMFSWPPATTISASPHFTACAASITAFRPEPQTLLMVRPGTPIGSPALMTVCRAGFWPEPAVEHLAHDHFGHRIARHAGLGEQALHHVRAQVGRGRAGERAAELADRRALRGHDHDIV